MYFPKYKYVSVLFEDGTGIQFTSSDFSAALTGTMDSAGILVGEVNTIDNLYDDARQMNNNNYKNSLRFYLAQVIWIIAILLYTAVILIENSLFITLVVISYSQLHQLAVFGVILLLIKELLQFKFDEKYIIKSLLLGIVFGILFLISFKAVDTDTLSKYSAQAFCYAFSARNTNWKHTGIIIGCELLIMLSCLFGLTVSGILPNYVFIQSGGDRIRQSLGFNYCLQYMACLLNAILLIISARQKKVHLISLLLLLVFSGLVYRMTDARVAFLGICIVIFAAVVNKIYPTVFGKIKILFGILTVSPIIYLITSIFMAIYYDPEINWMQKLNSILEERLALSHKAYINYPPQLFGQYVSWQGAGAGYNGYTSLDSNNYNWVDNFYVKEMIDHGIIYVVLLVAFITVALICCFIKHEYLSILLFALLYGIGLIDDNLRLYCYNGLTLYAGYILMNFSNNKRKKYSHIKIRRRRNFSFMSNG